MVSALACDSRNWNSRSNSFVRAPASGGGSNAPRPAVSVPQLDVNAGGCRPRQARSCKNIACRGGIPDILVVSSPLQRLDDLQNWPHFQTVVARAISYTVGFRQSKTPFSTGLFFDWILLVFLVVGRVDFIVFVLFLEAAGVREYCCTAGEIGWQLCDSRFLREQRLDEPSSQRVGGFGLSRKPPKLRSWSCTHPRATKVTAGAAVVGSMGSRPRAAAVV